MTRLYCLDGHIYKKALLRLKSHLINARVPCIAGLLLSAAVGAHAQVLRSFGNTSFELPALAGGTCYAQVYDTVVPSWSTTATVGTQTGSCTLPGGTASGLIELWTSGFNGVPARNGNQFAELNADQPSALYQDVCVTTGETVSWVLSHRGRSGIDTMAFVVGDSPASLAPANLAATALVGGVLRASSDTAGNGTIVSCQNGSAVGNVTSCTKTTAGTWVDYAGTFVWNGSSGIKSVGFGAISASGGATIGNFLDAIALTIKPYLEFNSPPSSGLESVASPSALGIKITGTVSTAFTVPVTVTGGTATLGVDFSTPSGGATFNVTIPAGSYTTATVIPLGITIINDTLTETNETITFSIAASTASSAYVTSSTATCGGAPVLTTTYTIIDDDRPQLRINKTRLGGTGTINFPFTVTNTATASATIATLASGTAATVAALNTTAITTDLTAITVTETLPTGSAANGFWGLSAVSCIDANGGNSALGNTNPTTNIAGLPTATGFTIAAANVQHTSNITCDVTNVLVNAIDDTDTKVANLPSTTSVNTNDTYPTGSTFYSSGGTCAGRSPTTAVTANTTGVMSYTSPATAGATCTVIYQVCAPAPNATVCDTATLTVTASTPEASLLITKTDSKAISSSGGTNNYVVTLTNQGPSPVSDVIVTDAATAGITCPASNTVVCSVITAGAVCPAGPLTFANLTAGLAIATLPANSALQFAYTCNVN